MTGFRVALGGACELYSLDPDLVTLGKIVGGGLPVGVFGGKQKYMDMLAPLGPVYQAGTLSGNPLAMAAGIATVGYLQEHAAKKFMRGWRSTAKAVAEGVAAEGERAGVLLTTNRVGAMWTWFFNEGPVTNYDEAATSDTPEPSGVSIARCRTVACGCRKRSSRLPIWATLTDSLKCRRRSKLRERRFS